MVIQIVNSGDGTDPNSVAKQLHAAIAESIPEAEIAVEPTGIGHFEVRVTSEKFKGQTRVQQHQLVYSAIWHLMSGDAPPVHAIDRMECVVPE